MAYALTRRVFEEKLRIPIDDERAVSIQQAVHGALGCLSVEEKFNLVLENFAEFEGDLLQGALNRSLFQVGEWSTAVGELHQLNRRLVNLLATARLYVDQVPHNLSALFGEKSGIEQEFTASKSREYDGRLGYRVMEAMRNYVQHRSLPIHVISHRSALREHGNGSFAEHIVTAEIHPQEYREDGKFKANVLAELLRAGEKVELPPLVRQYIAGLAAVHDDLRTHLAPHTANWDSIVEACGADFLAGGASSVLGLALVRLTGDRTYEVIVHISPGTVTRRRSLEAKNSNLKYYERVLVASRPTGR